MDLITVIEYAGIVAFAITGVITAIEKNLDVFGCIVLGFTTAVGGGILRDILLGYLPPAVLRTPDYAIIAIISSLVTFLIAAIAGKKIKNNFNIYSQIINVFDSMGLAVFAVAGTQQAHNFGFIENKFLSVFIGLLTCVGGGVLRDIFAGKIPTILKKRIYALAALAGAITFQILTEYSLCKYNLALVLSIAAVLVVRTLATIFHWNMPSIKELADDESK
ncbi:MAG: trimeric intracellular cation channel family protein [Clostridiales bacterium]|nr:trimeric intracellular cation channel family protein [Clostridiales bacterium]